MSLEAITIIDLDTSQPFMSVVHGKQYDTVRTVEAHLYFSGVKWYVPDSNIYALVSYRKSDNIGGFYDITESGVIAVSVNADDRSIIYIALDAQILRTAGEVKVETVFYDTITNGRLSSFSFIVDVEEASVREVDLASNPYFNILAEQIHAVLDAETKLTGLTADAEQLAPDDDPTVTVTGGTGADDPYNLHIGIPSMPGMTATGSRLATGALPTVTLTGGTEPGEDFNIDVGVPSMPGMTVSATRVSASDNPTAVITGGTQPGQAFNIAFGIPSGIGIKRIVVKYGVSMSESTFPTIWYDDISSITMPDGSILWTQNTVVYDDDTYTISYSKAAQGYPGPPGVAVQDTEPESNVKFWIDPTDETHPIVIPEYTADEDAMIHSFSGIILTTVRTLS